MAMAGYLVIAGITGMAMTYLKNVINGYNMKLRLHYLGDTLEKLVTMDYKYTFKGSTVYANPKYFFQ